MAQTIKEERLRWILPIVNGELCIKDVMRVCPYGQRSLERWLAVYKQEGEEALVPKSTRPKTHPNETPIRIKERIIELRKAKKVCALKLKWKLAKQGVQIHERTIGKILKTENLIRKYKVRKLKYKYLKVPLLPGELIEIDVKYVPERIGNKRYFQYTAIDCASRWRLILPYEEQSSFYSIEFLKEVMKAFKHRIRAVKTDNGAIFTNRYNGTYKRADNTPKGIHALDLFCQENQIIHYLIDPGKPAQNGKVEKSHSSDQSKLYDENDFSSFQDLRRKMRKWNTEYNNLEHCGLNGLTPNEFLRNYELTLPPNVCT